jgi:iron-sulfur cluster repair protein YtfE (RIC family)
MQTETKIDPTASVNDVITRYPATIPVFNKFGLDTCCGGGAPIVDAARRDGADLGALLDELRKAAAAA